MALGDLDNIAWARQHSRRRYLFITKSSTTVRMSTSVKTPTPVSFTCQASFLQNGVNKSFILVTGLSKKVTFLPFKNYSLFLNYLSWSKGLDSGVTVKLKALSWIHIILRMGFMESYPNHLLCVKFFRIYTLKTSTYIFIKTQWKCGIYKQWDFIQL